MKFIDFFSGIGGFHSGLERAGMECVGWCEFDKFAQASYRAMYDTDNLWFGDDVTKVKGKDLPKADLWAFGFPCQDISIAGNQKGIKKGTRSGLFYEIMRLLDECEENKPKWLMCENVKNLLSIDNGRGFLNVIGEMAERGYSIEWKVYNSKDYGVPQNRERVYIVGYYGERCSRELLPIRRENQSTIDQIGNLTENKGFGGNPQSGRVYSVSGVSPTINTCDGGNLEVKVLIKNATKTGYLEAKVGDGIDLAYPDSETRRARVQPQQSNTLTTSDNLGVLVDDESIRIRKLTPKEYWRLQGFSDEQFEKAAAINSNSQLYKQAGNAVTVNVVEEIGRHIVGRVVNEETCKNK
jgi:DNA (cytosine-5)-methyltransferase 1|nr:MAG TPA: Cytosine specific methyltransferase [Caudoviricetes sp.]